MRSRHHTRASVAAALFTATLAVLAFGWAATAFAVDSGSPFWTRAYAAAGDQQFTQVAACPDGDVVVAGTTDPGEQHVVLARYSPSGKRRWLKVIDAARTTDDWSPKVAVDRSGNAVVLYTRTVVPSTTTTIMVHKYSPRGRRLWKRSLDGGAGGLNSGSGIVLGRTGDVYVSGNVTAPGPAEASLIARLRARNGKVVVRSLQSGVGSLERITALIVDARGYAYATGYGDRGDGKEQAVTVKVRPSGTVAWSRAFPGADDYITLGTHVALGAGGRLYVAARQRRFGPASTLIALHYSTGGALRWSDAWDVPGGDMDSVSAVATDRYGNLFFAGAASTSGPAPSHAYVARWTPSKARWTWVKPTTDADATNLTGVVADQGGGCWAVGSYVFAFRTTGEVRALYATRVSRSGSPRWEQVQVRIGLRLAGMGLAGCSGGLAAAGWTWDGVQYDGLVTKIRK